MSCIKFALAVSFAVGWSAAINNQAVAGDDPFADSMVAYDPGTNPSAGYTEPATTLGSPERFTGESICDECSIVVSAFNTAFGYDEIVSIGEGGQLILAFDQPITDDPNNLYGVDLLVFGNTGFADAAHPNGIVIGFYGNDGGIIQVSMDGREWLTIPDYAADGPMPTIGYLDAGAYDIKPGAVETDFTRPVDPNLSLADFLGLVNEQVIELYRGSGGGTPVDLASVGLAQASFVRILNPAGSGEHVEIDAMCDVVPRLPGDVNLDGVVDIDDLFDLISVWGATVPGGIPADFNNDGVVNIDDLFIVIANWTL